MALSLTPGPLDHEASERLELPAYHAEFRKRFERARECWRLDRGQVFAVPGDESWEAFRRGDWEESLRLISGRRAELAEDRRRNDARGMTIRRVRVVALPPGPYVQWELRLLLLRDEHGQPARVLLDRDITGVEELTRLPEISTLDTEVMYQVVYDDSGAADHAIRYTDQELVTRRRDLIAGLYDCGEPIGSFFRREIAPLPPPRSSRA